MAKKTRFQRLSVLSDKAKLTDDKRREFGKFLGKMQEEATKKSDKNLLRDVALAVMFPLAK